MMPTDIKKRAVLTIEYNWDEILRSKDGEVWVTCKEFREVGKHGTIKIIDISKENCPRVQASEDFQVTSITKKTLNVTHENPNCQTLFVSPVIVFSHIHKKSIISLDVTLGGLGISSSVDNKLHIWDSSNGEIRRILQGHVWDVYICRFFPSGIVVLSGGADMQLKIWSAETGQCPVTFKGHTAAITDTAIIDKGRNVISVSKDGTSSLWDCGQMTRLAVIAKYDSEINSCDLSAVDIELGQPENPPSQREIGTEGKLMILGCENGFLHGIGLHSRKPIFSFNCMSAINCCKFLSNSRIVCGCQDGHIHMLDISKPSEPLITWEESESPVLCILPYKQGFFAGRRDGTCTFYSLKSENVIQLTGPDIEPVYSIAADNIFVYTSCRDAKIRKYKLPVVLT